MRPEEPKLFLKVNELELIKNAFDDFALRNEERLTPEMWSDEKELMEQIINKIDLYIAQVMQYQYILTVYGNSL